MKFVYNKSSELLIQKLKREAINYGGEIIGNNSQGTFQIKSKIGFFKGNYNISDRDITISIDKKPLLISMNLIEKEIKKYFDNN